MNEVAPDSVLWKANPGPQTRALASPVFELLYGGGAGGGKSEFLLVGPLRWVGHPGFAGVLFRRTYKELEDGLIRRAWDIYPHLGAEYHEQKHRWEFPSGARITLSHLQHEKDALEHRGAEYQYAGFDELPSFTPFQYRYIISRLRSAHGIPIRLRGSCNPEPGWVRDRFAPWVRSAADYAGLRVADGEVLNYVVDAGDIERYVPAGTPKSFSRAFIAARLEDNPVLMENDPAYADRLRLLDPVQQARLRDGDWETEYSAGLMFQRGWFPLVDAAPVHATRVRFWDRAATEVKFKGQASLQPQAINDPDWTAGVLMCREKAGRCFVEDVARQRGKPGDVERLILTTAELDEQKYGRHGFSILLEQEPGASGEAEIANYMKLLARWHVVPIRHTGDKVRRAGPVSAQGMAGNVSVCRGAWNGAYFSELEAFPKGKHDDQVDGTSGAYNHLSSVPLESSGSSRGERRATNSGGF